MNCSKTINEMKNELKDMNIPESEYKKLKLKKDLCAFYNSKIRKTSPGRQKKTSPGRPKKTTPKTKKAATPKNKKKTTQKLPLNLYILENPEYLGPSYDMLPSIIVAAPDELTAKMYYPCRGIKEGLLTEDEWYALPREATSMCWPRNYKSIEAELIGTALPNVKEVSLIY